MTNDEQDRVLPQTLAFQYKDPTPIFDFDETDLDALDLSDDSRESASNVQSLVPQTVLLGSLLEHLCSLHESDSERAHQLFLAICDRLTKIHVLSPIAYLHEFTSIRSQYKTAFYNVIQSSIANLRKDVPTNALPLANGPCNLNSKINGAFEFNVSRYKDEFIQLSKIGRGGYGNVYQAKSKIDNQIYAVKTIHFTTRDLHRNKEESSRLLREVQILAGLQHSNIVRYHAAWIEHKYIPERDKGGIENDSSGDDLFLNGDHENIYHKKSSTRRLSSSNESISWENKYSFSRKENNSSKSTKHEDGPSKFWGYSSESSSSSILSPHMKHARFFISSQSNGDSVTWDHNRNPQHTCENDNIFGQCIACESYKTSMSPPSNDNVIITDGVRRDRELRKVQSFIIPDTTVRELAQDPEKLIDDHVSTSFDSPHKRSYSMSSMHRSVNGKHLMPAKLFPVSGKKNIQIVNHINEKMVMYIQMQLCHMSLKEWLFIRNKKLSSINNTNALFEADAISILKQLLSALSYIHGKDLIHRDIKPRNIFINLTDEQSPHVLIGDFGLARKNNNMEPITPLIAAGNPFRFHKSQSYTSGVGTASYAAPEQLNEEIYDTKADMYSVGIVIYELWCPLGTGMERANHLKLLRSPDVQIPEEFKCKYPLQATAVYQLLQHDPTLRPSADEMLKSSFIAQTSGKIITDQRKRIWELERENSYLKNLVKELRKKQTNNKNQNT